LRMNRLIILFCLGLSCLDISRAEDIQCKKGWNFQDDSIVIEAGDSFAFDTVNNRRNKYRKNQYCTADYVLGSSCTGAIVTCDPFNLRSNRRCTRDYLDIYDEADFHSFCRDNGPVNFRPVGDFSVIFVSDNRGSAEGFKCQISCADGSSPSTTASPPTTGSSTPSTTGSSSTATPPTTTSQGPSGDCKCGLAKRKTRIVGGAETEENEYPWQALVYPGNYLCGGAVIGDQWVLTAAHCTEGLSANSVKVHLGEHDRSDPNDKGKQYTVEQVVNHPDYNDRTYYNDYALLKLSSKIDWAANEHIRPVCLPSDASETYVGREAIVAGWGTTSSGGSTSSVLLDVALKVITNVACNNAYGSIGTNNLCANVDGGGKDSCQGDSGGPLISTAGDGVSPGQNYEHIGVVSWGNGCALAAFPGVYARTTSILSWISSTTSGSWSTCPRT